MIYQLALFGHPVSHSLSPQLHQGFAEQFGLNIRYDLVDVTIDQLHNQVHDFFAQGGNGANITVPHKQHIMAVADRLTERAQQAGAVNTLFIRNKQLWGDNTDGEGLINDLKQKQITLRNQRILVIGAGGAVQGILPSLIQAQPKSIHLSNRTHKKAQELASTSALCQVLDETQITTGFDVIINGTSLGHQGKSPPLKPEWIHHNTIAYDLSYGAAAEPFLTTTKDFNIQQTYDGLGMLHHQAALAFEIWFGKKPC